MDIIIHATIRRHIRFLWMKYKKHLMHFTTVNSKKNKERKCLEGKDPLNVNTVGKLKT
jgi:hypothetical protein